MESSVTFDTHPPEETLEEYCFNRLPEEGTAAIEEHLLLCEICQHTLEDLDEYISLMKATTAEYKLDAAPKTSTGRIWNRVREAWAIPWNPGWAVALGLLVVGAVLSWAMISIMARRIEPPQLSASVMLAAVRGGENFTMNQAPAGRPLDLAVDLADLPPSDTYRLEVVSTQGQSVWNAAPEPSSNGKLSARIAKGLSPGIYWVRLYSTQGELLREFGLRVQ